MKKGPSLPSFAWLTFRKMRVKMLHFDNKPIRVSQKAFLTPPVLGTTPRRGVCSAL